MRPTRYQLRQSPISGGTAAVDLELSLARALKTENDSSGVRTHALSDQRLKLAP